MDFHLEESLLLAGKPGTGLKNLLRLRSAGELNYPYWRSAFWCCFTSILGSLLLSYVRFLDSLEMFQGASIFSMSLMLLVRIVDPNNDVVKARRYIEQPFYKWFWGKIDSNAVIVCATNHIEALGSWRYFPPLCWRYPIMSYHRRWNCSAFFKSRFGSYVA